MTDIVELLRARGDDNFIRDYPLLREAADEIERLRDELHSVHAHINHLRDMTARYREAVTVLLEGMGGHYHWDASGTSGVNCPVCQRQQEAMIRAGELVGKP